MGINNYQYCNTIMINYNNYLQILGYKSLFIGKDNDNDLQIKLDIQMKNNMKKSTNIVRFTDITKKNTNLQVPKGPSPASASLDNKENDVVYHIPKIPNVENQDNNTDTKCVDVYSIINAIYLAFIFVLISWKIIYIVIYSIQYGDIKFILRNLYDCAIPIQFIIGKHYFSTSHFDIIMEKAKTFHEHQYKRYTNIYATLLMIFSICFGIIELILIIVLEQQSGMSLYSTLYNNSDKVGKSYLTILFFVGNLYSINIFFSNVFAFSIVFRIHSLDIQSFYNDIKDNYDYVASELCNNYIRLRNDYEESVDKLNYTFSTVILIGGVSTYIIMIDARDQVLSSFQIMYTIAFILLMAIYIKSILVVKIAKRNLGSLAYSNKYVEKLLTRHEIHRNNNHSVPNIISSSNLHNDNSTVIRSAILDTENAETLDWLVQYIIIGDKWDTFRLFGFQFDDMALFKKGAVMIMMLYVSSDIQSIMGN